MDRMANDHLVFHQSPSSSQQQQYRGVRKRKWGKWVSEIRQPGTKTRIWLGSFESAEMAAVAHDVAALRLRGRDAQLNFPGCVGWLPRPASSHPGDVRAAAAEAADRVRCEPALVATAAPRRGCGGGGGGGGGGDDLLLAAAAAWSSPGSGQVEQLLAGAGSDEEVGLDMADYSPGLWAEMAEAMLLDPPSWEWDTGVVGEVEAAQCYWSHGSLWDAC
ncbi:hypothetical protein ACP4OV_024369 [Aristida adscensionis]